MNDHDLVGFREPFARLFHQGWVQQGGSKMSKTRGNVTGPDGIVEAYGADAVRLNILFMGPADQDMEWTDSGIEGMSRFVRRLWRTVLEVAESAPAEGPGDTALARKAHETIVRVSRDVERFHFNTPIAAVMELVNELTKDTAAPDARFAAETAVSLIQPYAPHLAEELWQRLGHERLWEQPWPEPDPRLLERDTFELVVQVNGRVRDRLEVDADAGRGRAGRARAPVGEGARAPERQAGPEDDRRPAEARQSRRRLGRRLANPRVDMEVDAAGLPCDDPHALGLGSRAERALVRAHGVGAGIEPEAVEALRVGDDVRRLPGTREREPDARGRLVARLADAADRRDRAAHHLSVQGSEEQSEG